MTQAEAATDNPPLPSGTYGSRVLVTGAAGFIGSNAARHLLAAKEYTLVVGVDKLSYCSSEKAMRELEKDPRFRFHHQDILELETLAELFRRYRVDTVLHFAAESDVDSSFLDPLKFSSNNYLGTHTVLEASRICGIRRFLYVSTDEVYGESSSAGSDGTGSSSFRETSRLKPSSPYAASKAAAELICHAYLQSFRLPVITVRLNNLFGPFQYPEKIIPRFALLLLQGQKCPIHGSGHQTRNYLYISDALRALDVILRSGNPGDVYNVGGDAEVRSIDVCRHLCELIRPGEEYMDYVRYVVDRPFNDQAYVINCDRLKLLGWRQDVSFPEGLQRTVEWYRRYGFDWWDGSAVEALRPKLGG